MVKKQVSIQVMLHGTIFKIIYIVTQKSIRVS